MSNLMSDLDRLPVPNALTVYDAATRDGHTEACATAQHMTMASSCICGSAPKRHRAAEYSEAADIFARLDRGTGLGDHRAQSPAALLVLARAEKRLTAMIARRGIDDEVLAVAGTYERMYRAAIGAWVPGPRTVTGDAMALAEAVA